MVVLALGLLKTDCDPLLLLLPLLLQLLDELLKEEHVMDVIGCLEYDPDLTATQQHRQFLSSAVVFKEVVPITSQDVLAKIHQTYRIQYLKDVILPRRCGWQHVLPGLCWM